MPRARPGLWLVALASVACSGAQAASSSSLAAQTQAAATPKVTATTSDVPMSEQMMEAQLLCTTALTYEPCGLVANGETVNCFMLCQGQIATGAANLAERGASDCVNAGVPPGDAGSPACDFQLRGGSPVDPGQLRAACNARCRELAGDAGLAPRTP